MEKRIRPYEVLVRIHPDGSSAAHVGYVEDIIDDDGKTVIASRELPVKALSLAGPEFDALIPALDQAILKQNAALLEERATLTKTNEGLARKCDALIGEVGQLSRNLEEARKQSVEAQA